MHWWPRLSASHRRRLSLATSLAGLGFLVAALRSEGLRESALTSLVLVGPATLTARASAAASLYYYVLTGVCLLLGFTGLIFSDPLEGSDGAIRLCRKILEKSPERYFKPDQYFNPVNAEAHYESTGPEIWNATNGTVTHFIAGIGTGGTIMGTGRFLKERNAAIQVIAVEPDDAWHGLEGLKHMASSIVPGIYHEEQLDLKIGAATDTAYETVYRLGTEQGLVVGQSSGAAMHAAIEVGRDLEEAVIVVIFPDFGDRYLSTSLWGGWRDWLARGASSGAPNEVCADAQRRPD